MSDERSQRGETPRMREAAPSEPADDVRERSRDRGWRTGDVLRAAALVAALYVLLRLLWFAHTIFFIAFLGVLFGIALSAGVDRLKAVGVPRALGAIAIITTCSSILIALGFFLAPTLRQQTRDLRQNLPTAIDRVERWVARQQGSVVGVIIGDDAIRAAASSDSLPRGDPAADTGAARPGGDSLDRRADTVVVRETEQEPRVPSGEGKVRTFRERLSGELGNVSRYLFPFISSSIAILAGILMILFIAIYISVQPQLYGDGMLHLFPPGARARAAVVLANMALMLRRWLLTQLIAMIVVGVITVATLMLLRVPSALALGVLAGLLEFIPIIGPIIAAVPAIGMAFVDSPEKAAVVAVAFIVIQQAEAQLITPLLMKEGVDLPPVLTLVVQALMAAVFGFMGLLVAVPLLAAAMVPLRLLHTHTDQA